MKTLMIFALLCVQTFTSQAQMTDDETQNNKDSSIPNTKARQTMNVETMIKIIESNKIKVEHINNTITFKINDFPMTLIYDNKADRMRIVCPIANLDDLSKEQIAQAMEANFHTALDARYAISKGVVWSAFIHPLSDLSSQLFQSALEQTYIAAATFGNEYSSGALSFPKGDATDNNVSKNKPIDI